MLRFRNPEKFISGNLSGCLPHWKLVLKDYPKASEIFRYVSEGVRVQEFFVPFKGTFRGRSYNADVPPVCCFLTPLRVIISATLLRKPFWKEWQMVRSLFGVRLVK